MEVIYIYNSICITGYLRLGLPDHSTQLFQIFFQGGRKKARKRNLAVLGTLTWKSFFPNVVKRSFFGVAGKK